MKLTPQPSRTSWTRTHGPWRTPERTPKQGYRAVHGGGTIFPPVDMLVCDDSDGEDEDDEGHDDLAVMCLDKEQKL